MQNNRPAKRLYDPNDVLGNSAEPDLVDRQPPCDVKIEQALVGSMFMMPQCIDDVVKVVSEGDFYDEAHRTLFRHMVGSFEVGQPFDAALVLARLKQSGELEKVGGAGYLAKTINCVPNAAHATYYAEIVRNLALRRRLILTSTEALKQAYENDEPAKEIVDRAEAAIQDVSDEAAKDGIAATVDIKDVLQAAVDRCEARASGHFADGVRTGLSELDNMTGGFHAGELTIMAARPSVGKSACALRIATSAAFQYGHSVLFFSLEMSAMEVADRVLSMDARVNLHHMRRGYTSNDQRQKLAESASSLAASRLFINDCGSQTPTQLAAEFRRFKRKHGADLVVIDYLQYMTAEYRRDENDEQRLGNAAKRLKYLARDFNVPVLCVAQLNRETEKGAVRAPRLSDIRGSGQIEQHADNVFFIHREAYYNSSLQPSNPEEAETAEFIVAKQRNGPCGSFNLAWVRAYARFDNPASTAQEQQAAAEFTGHVQPEVL